MRILLDTHVLLWFHTRDPRLSARSRSNIESGRHDCRYSIVSLWEITIKHALGKLELVDGLEASFAAMERANLAPLQLDPSHLLALSLLPHHHRDPFDRMLVAQAISEGMHLMTSDPQLRAYEVPLLHA
ncbi:MAG: type II toxin-antitoxin system VapC family toxin [Bacteroidetes bacterium]|nr:type II toxin-antitoxin system VapC family toxin [Bacteroidota bacterium]MBS1945620.1 type II toxin-antitoxin system VapC family toxin [Bacteroidota bacterium]